MRPQEHAIVPESPTDGARAQDVLYLCAYDGRTERALIEAWLAQSGQADASALFYRRRRERPTAPQLIDALCEAFPLADATRLTPVRIAWLPRERDGRRSARWRDLLRMRDPRNPSERRKARRARSGSESWRVIEGEPATLADLRARWEIRVMPLAANDDDARPLARFIARQAELALERAEYRVQGARYKVPRVSGDDVADSPAFRDGLSRLARQLERDEASLLTEARAYLDELRTAHDPFVLDLATRAFHWMYARAYGEVDVVPAEIEALRETFARHAVILLPSHKTNLDSPVVESVLSLNGLPPPTLFAGINMSFWPVGPLMRRAGRVFLRRKISNNPVYKFTLREWLAYLIEKRFNLEWFPEGTRSRIGKLLPPKVGLLAYAAEAYRNGHVEDLMLVPIAIIYDQAVEVAEFAREAQGGEKKAENLAWMLRGLREMRKPQGKVYLRIAPPVSMRDALGPPGGSATSPDEDRNVLQKLALAVSWRTNQVTPITGVSIVTFSLLAAGQRAVTLHRIVDYVRLVVRHARERGQPLTESAQLETPEQVSAVLDELIRTGPVRVYDQGPEAVYTVAEGQHLAAAFYRNAMLHFVLDRAIGELAVLTATEEPRGRRLEAFFEAALALREALKFEFFFRERQDFLDGLALEMDRNDASWRERLEDDGDPIAIHRAIFGRGIAHAVLRPFIEAYHVVADVLVAEPPDAPFDETVFYDKCQRLGRQYLLQRALRNAESVSRPLFHTGTQLAKNLKLTEPGPDIAERRAHFAARSRASLARVDLADDAAGLLATRAT